MGAGRAPPDRVDRDPHRDHRSGGRARYGAGGAVTLLSDAAEEAEETMVKARPFLEAANATVAGW